jgi:8-oxo-dGTP diphosphatase
VTTEDTRHSVSVAGVVIDEDGRALVIQRRDNAHWEPPGGILERDETITDGLLREVKEETGLIVEPIALTGIYKYRPSGTTTVSAWLFPRLINCRLSGLMLVASRPR